MLGALSPGQLARTLRTAFDPYARSELTAAGRVRPRPRRAGRGQRLAAGRARELGALPVRRRAARHLLDRRVAARSTSRRCSWTRCSATPGVVRTVSVTFEPLAGDRSTREVEAAITRDRADRELRARFGQSETARQRQAADATRRREAELAAGHSEVRLSGFVTVTGRDPDDLRRACAEVAGAGRAGAAGAAPPLRPAGRRVHLHAAAVPGAAVSRARRARRSRGRRHPLHHPPRPGDLPVRQRRRARRPRRVHRDATPAAGRSVTTRGSSTATAALDDPNAIVLGKLGQGKSALVKTLLWRMLLFGRRAFVLDVKREYGPLCDAVGVRPISLVPGAGVRLNPLASRPEEHAQLELLRAVTVAALGDALTQVEAGALREALRVVRARGDGEPTLPQIAGVLFAPVDDMARRLETTIGRAGRRRAPRRARAPGSVRGAAARHVRRPHDAGARPRRQAARARPARRPRLARGRDPDGLRERLDQRAAGAHRPAARPRAADQRRRRVVEDRPAHRAGRVVSGQLQAGAAVRRDEPGRAAQARRPPGGRATPARAPRASPRAWSPTPRPGSSTTRTRARSR